MDNNIKLVLNNELQWSKKWLDYYIKHRKAFSFTTAMYSDINNKISRGEKIFMRNMLSEDIYTIIVEDRETGFIRVTPYDNDSAVEISVSILDEFREQGIASNAIKQLLKQSTYYGVIGVVHDCNPCANMMNHIFEKLGFEKKKECGAIEWCKKVET